MPVVAEGLRQRVAKPGEDKAAQWMADHAGDGMILIDDSVNPVLTVIDADFDRVAAPFSGRRWAWMLRDPGRAEWVYVDTESPQDQVARAIKRGSDLRRRLRPPLPQRHVGGLPTPSCAGGGGGGGGGEHEARMSVAPQLPGAPFRLRARRRGSITASSSRALWNSVTTRAAASAPSCDGVRRVSPLCVLGARATPGTSRSSI